MDYKELPSITIDLNPVLEAYCRWKFANENNSGPIRITRKEDIGKIIYSNISFSDHYEPNLEMINPVTFILPQTENGKYILKKNYLSLDSFGKEKIKDFIDSEFRIWIKRCFENGYDFKFEQREIIEAILRGLNVRNNSDNYEMIKKIDYRKKRSREEKRFKYILTSCI